MRPLINGLGAVHDLAILSLTPFGAAEKIQIPHNPPNIFHIIPHNPKKGWG